MDEKANESGPEQTACGVCGQLVERQGDVALPAHVGPDGNPCSWEPERGDASEEYAGTTTEEHRGHGCELDPDLGRGDPLVDPTAAWPMLDVLVKLADAADVLFDRHNYDGHGHEEIAAARDAARRYVRLMRKAEEVALSLPPVDENGVPRLSQKQADRFVEILTSNTGMLPEMAVVPMAGAVAPPDPPAPPPEQVIRDGFMRATKELAEVGRWLTDLGVPARGTLLDRLEVFAARRYNQAPLPAWLRPIQAALDSVKERVPESVHVGLSAVIKAAAREERPNVVVDGKAARPGPGLYGRLHAYARGRREAFEEAVCVVSNLPRGTWGDSHGERSPWPVAADAIRALVGTPPRSRRRELPMPPEEPEIEEAVGDVPEPVVVHETHCCLEHGCKYGDALCPVANGVLSQEGPCMDCDAS